MTIDTSTGAVERLSPYAVDGGCDAYGQMEEDEIGDYVSFEDYEAILAERDTLRQALSKARNDALEEAAVITENEGRKSRKYPGETVAETYCDDAAELIRELKSLEGDT